MIDNNVSCVTQREVVKHAAEVHSFEKQSETLHIIREATVRYRKLTAVKQQIKGVEDVPSLFWKLVRNRVQENFCAFYLDTDHAVVSASLLFLGTADKAQVHPREIYQVAVLTGAVAIIVAHNHPSGNSRESSADRLMTKRLKEAGELLGIKLLDSIVIGDPDINSALSRGWL
ncbi:MAG: JAB domain-containing protein [Symploca sp. SIO2C1]|nr:JAB domain-containing protein [Symploca sp. SIO2C1]